MNILDDKHRAELHASGVSDEVIAAGIYSAEGAEIREVGHSEQGWTTRGRVLWHQPFA